MAQKAGARNAGGQSSEKFISVLKKIKIELAGALEDGRETEMQAAIENILEEIDWTLRDEAKEARVAVPEEFRHQLEEVQRNLRALDDEIISLRKRESSFETNQEEFYLSF